jgi:hypothetical protein
VLEIVELDLDGLLSALCLLQHFNPSPIVERL